MMDLHTAALLGDLGELRAALATSPDVNARNESCETPLHLAAAAASPDAAACVAALLEAGADVEARDDKGRSPLLRFAKASPGPPSSTPDLTSASLLLARSASVNAAAQDGMTPLLHATRAGKDALLAQLLAPGTDADLGATYAGESLVEQARMLSTLAVLVQHPASPLHAYSSPCRDSVQQLLASGLGASAGASRAAAAGGAPRPLLLRAAVCTTHAAGAGLQPVRLGADALAGATCRLARDADVEAAFAPAAPWPAEDLAVRLESASLGGEQPAPAPPALPVEQRVLRELLRTPATAWRPPPTDSPFFLPMADFVELLERAYAVLSLERTVLRLQAPVKIFGDVHGQYEDLMALFGAYGSPSPLGDLCATDYLFAGDFVDRGRHSLETLALLLALKVAHPAQVHLLRGNHEDTAQNQLHGFYDECVRRMPQPGTGPLLFARANEVFEMLPLGALVETPPPPPPPPGAPAGAAPPPVRVFVVHGGVGRLQRIEELDSLVRPFALAPDVAAVQGGDAAAQLLADDVLWSDPLPRDDEPPPADGANAARGAGTCFGPACVRAFCERNGVAALVRAHEVPAAGVELFAAGLGVTVFSAADYPEQGGGVRKGNYAGLLWMGRDGSLHARLLAPRPPPPPQA